VVKRLELHQQHLPDIISDKKVASKIDSLFITVNATRNSKAISILTYIKNFNLIFKEA
jgi:hypothetical protein